MPNISTSFPPKTLKMGPQSVEIGVAGKFREIQGLWRISTENPDPGNSGKFILGTPFCCFGGDFLGEMRMAKVDMLGRSRRRTNVQQLTCNIDLSNSFYYRFFSFVLLELKPFVLKGKPWTINSEKVPKSVKNYERFCPLVVAL